MVEYLGVEDAADLAGQYAELANTLDQVLVALKRRLALASGHEHLALSGQLPKTPDMCLQYIEALQEHLMQVGAGHALLRCRPCDVVRCTQMSKLTHTGYGFAVRPRGRYKHTPVILHGFIYGCCCRPIPTSRGMRPAT